MLLKSDGSCQTCGSCNNETNNDVTQSNGTASKPKKEKHHVEFDHLSIVSEESQRSPNEDRLLLSVPENNSNNSSNNKKAPESPFPLAELQSVIPSLAHFENLQYDNIGPGNVGMLQVLYLFFFVVRLLLLL